eukprot:19146_6
MVLWNTRRSSWEQGLLWRPKDTPNSFYSSYCRCRQYRYLFLSPVPPMLGAVSIFAAGMPEHGSFPLSILAPSNTKMFWARRIWENILRASATAKVHLPSIHQDAEASGAGRLSGTSCRRCTATDLSSSSFLS